MAPQPSDKQQPRAAIVFIVAHPDDVARSFGGTAWLLKDRYQLHVLCASRGERGYHWTGTGETPPNAELAATREAEERAACAELDATVAFLGAIDGEIFAGRQLVEQVAATLRELKPTAVFTHGHLTKSDHAAVAMIALQALHLSGLFWEVELYQATWPGETLHDHADVYVDISTAIAGKRAQIRHHRSQNPREEDVEQVIARNAALGKVAWCDHAEAYLTALAPIARRWNRPAGRLLMQLGNGP